MVVDQKESNRAPTRTRFIDSTSADWIRFMVNKKTCQVSAMTEFDERYALKKMHSDNVSENKIRPPSNKRRCLKKAAAAADFTSSTTMESSDFPQPMGQQPVETASFITTLATNLPLGYIFGRICSRLHVAANQVAFFISFSNSHDPGSTNPIVLDDADTSLKNALLLRRQPCPKSPGRMFLCFRVLPFPLFSEDGVDHRSEFRFMEFLIVNSDMRLNPRQLSNSLQEDGNVSDSSRSLKRARVDPNNASGSRAGSSAKLSSDPSSWVPDGDFVSPDRIFLVSPKSVTVASVARRLREKYEPSLGSHGKSQSVSQDGIHSYWTEERATLLQT